MDESYVVITEEGDEIKFNKSQVDECISFYREYGKKILLDGNDITGQVNYDLTINN